MAQDSIGYVLSQHHSDAQIAGSNFLYFATGPYQGYSAYYAVHLLTFQPQNRRLNMNVHFDFVA
jgi:hypothetical protein